MKLIPLKIKILSNNKADSKKLRSWKKMKKRKKYIMKYLL
jgi:hypothetical protein